MVRDEPAAFQHRRERVRDLSGVFLTALIPFMRAPLSGPKNLRYHWLFAGTQTFRP